MEKNIRAEAFVGRDAFERKHGHRAAVIWFTGLSASGKSTLARAVQRALFNQNKYAVVLDGDNLRRGINEDLGFSPDDREENIRRVRQIAKLFYDHGAIVLTAFISPYKEARDKARDLFPEGDFFEVHVNCALEICKERDPKGLYKRAISGLLTDFTGISAPYETPQQPELRLDTHLLSVEDSVTVVLQLLHKHLS